MGQLRKFFGLVSGDRKCAVCGTAMRLRLAFQTTCSSACLARARERGSTPEPKKTKKQRLCLFCGRRYEKAHDEQEFCNSQCVAKYRAIFR